MDADLHHLQNFSDVPFAIHAPATATGGRLAGAAAAAMAGRDVRLDESRGVAPARYREIVESIRAQIKAEVPAESGYRIEVFDRTAPRAAEGRRVDGGLLKGRFAKELTAFDGFATPFPDTAKVASQVRGCVLVGLPPEASVDDMLMQSTHGIPVPHAGITDEAFQRTSTWHELGHCLLGADEAKADTFAALMALRHGVYGKEQLSTLAAWRELEEWTRPNLEDDHYISAALWEVVARADALRADPRFMAMSIPEVAGVAKAISDRYALSPEAIKEAQAVRRGLQAGADRPEHFVKDAQGHAHRTDIAGWGAAHQEVPEIARMGQVLVNLLQGARPMQSFRYDAKGMHAHFDGLARDGDPTARAMLAAMDRPARRHAEGADFAEAIPYRFDGRGYAAQVLALSGSARYAGDAVARRAPPAPPPAMVMPAGLDEPETGFGFGFR